MMKHFFYIALAAVSLLLPTSCSDDEPQDDFDVIASTAAELSAALKSGQSVKLSSDITATDPQGYIFMSGEASAKLDMAGHTIFGGLYVGDGNLTIYGQGAINPLNGNDAPALYCKSGTITVEGDIKMTGSTDKDNQPNSCVYTIDGQIILKAGEYKCHEVPGYTEQYRPLNINNKGTGTITAYGGKFWNQNPENGDDGVGGTFVAPGYKAVKDASEDFYLVVPVK